MSKLESLIRLHEQELDERRRGLADAEAEVERIVAAQQALEDEIRAEQAMIGHSTETGFAYANFAQVAIARRQKLAKDHGDAAFHVDAMRASVATAFADLKKFELTAAHQAAQRLREEKRLEQNILDEIAQQQDRRKRLS
jgi:flagellar export protein FliJ